MDLFKYLNVFMLAYLALAIIGAGVLILKKRTAFYVILALAGAVLVVHFLIPKAYDHEGGFAGWSRSNDKWCLGYAYVKEPPPHIYDGATVYYCVGFPLPKP